MTDHHDHPPISDGDEPPAAARARALEALLVEKGVINRDQVREVIRERGWRIPVGYDADGAVSNIYRVGVCPTVGFAYPGGILRSASVGSEELDDGALEDQVARLLRESRRRARTDR